MEYPHITIFYAAVLGVIFSVLSLVVVILRRRNDVPYGDGGIPRLNSAIRAHGNFSEHVPIAIILLGLLEISEFSQLTLQILFLGLVSARISHAVAMFAQIKSKLYLFTRIFGAFTTWLVILSSALSLLATSLWGS